MLFHYRETGEEGGANKKKKKSIFCFGWNGVMAILCTFILM